jgi:NYN domain
MFRGSIKSGLFIDYDNADKLFPNSALSERIGNWLNWLGDGRFDPQGRKRSFVHKNVYWHPRHAAARAQFEAHGFKTKACGALAETKKGKSAVDLNLAIDVVDAAHTTRGLREIIILATDSDYLPLIDKLTDLGLATCIAISAYDISLVYEGRASLTLPSSALAQAQFYVPAPRRLFGFRAPAAQSPAQIPEFAPANDARAAFDLDSLAETVAALARTKPDLAVGRRSILPVLRTLEGFTENGAESWFGFASYKRLLTRIAARRPELELVKCYKGGVALVYNAAPPSGKRMRKPAAQAGEVLHLYIPSIDSP